jgi:4'-phosphopantetheinyl transferase EntD
MLRFSLKESVYKSIEPELKRYVSYKEVEVQPQFDGTASVTYLLVEPKKKISSIAQWIRFSPPAIIGDLYKAVRPTFWITCAYSFEFTET